MQCQRIRIAVCKMLSQRLNMGSRATSANHGSLAGIPASHGQLAVCLRDRPRQNCSLSYSLSQKSLSRGRVMLLHPQVIEKEERKRAFFSPCPGVASPIVGGTKYKIS
jgi:hypothetical protein